ncbi:MAG TPA: outer membrane beta-barrel protein [Candidatus Eisenbacteria bacterium]|nr:outer membrane beta-barrel protein [Candidatus Eisenbacteria bacterium]
MKSLMKLNGNGSRWTRRCVAGAVIAIGVASLSASAPPARAGEIVPSVGYSKGVDSDEAKSNLGLAIRGNLAGPAVQAELGTSYRSEERFGGDLKLRMVPVTASILVRPVPMLHADVGAGWYFTKFDYNDALLIDDETSQDFGVHLGGGLQVPVAPRAALDLTGRYVFMQDQESKLVPATFDPDFWNMSLGLAFKF